MTLFEVILQINWLSSTKIGRKILSHSLTYTPCKQWHTETTIVIFIHAFLSWINGAKSERSTHLSDATAPLLRAVKSYLYTDVKLSSEGKERLRLYYRFDNFLNDNFAGNINITGTKRILRKCGEALH